MNAMKAGGLDFEPHEWADKAVFNFERGIILERQDDSGWCAFLSMTGYHIIRESSYFADTAVLRLLEAVAALKPAVDKALGIADAPVGGWQPIETAPRDKQVVVCWAGDHREPIAVALVKINGYDTWVTPNGYSVSKCTHWIPIPPVPEASK